MQAKWTEQILDETMRARTRNHPDVTAEKLQRLRHLINESVRDCLVTGYEPLIDVLKLPDPDDRHILAAAIKAGAQIIVTANLRHFPADALTPWEIEAKSPDDFILDQINIDSRIVYSCVSDIATIRKNPAQTVEDVLGELESAGLVQSAAALR